MAESEFVVWTDDETRALVGIVGDTETQRKLTGTYRNKAVYMDVSAKMADKGFCKTWKQCRTKMKNLKTRYKKVRDHNAKSGRERISCPYYNELHRVWHDHPSVRPTYLLDSADADPGEGGTDQAAYSDEDNMFDMDDADDDNPDSRSPTHVPDLPHPCRTPSPSTEPSQTGSSTSTAPVPSPRRGPAPVPSPRSGRTGSKGTVKKRKKNKLDTALETFSTIYSRACTQEEQKVLKELQEDRAVDLAMHREQMAVLQQFLGVFTQGQGAGPPHNYPTQQLLQPIPPRQQYGGFRTEDQVLRHPYGYGLPVSAPGTILVEGPPASTSTVSAPQHQGARVSAPRTILIQQPSGSRSTVSAPQQQGARVSAPRTINTQQSIRSDGELLYFN